VLADLRLPVNRLEQRRHRLEELFSDVGSEAVAYEAKGAVDVRG
jgi:hypothetical protein